MAFHLPPTYWMEKMIANKRARENDIWEDRTVDCAGFSALKLSELTPFFLSSVIFQQSSVFILIVKSEQSEGHTDKSFSNKASAGRNNEKDTEAFPPLPSILCPLSLPDKSLFMLKVRAIRCVCAGNVNYFQPGQNQAIHMCQREMVGWGLSSTKCWSVEDPVGTTAK